MHKTNAVLPLPSDGPRARAELRSDDRRFPNIGSSSIAPGMDAAHKDMPSFQIIASSGLE